MRNLKKNKVLKLEIINIKIFVIIKYIKKIE